jgi:hypothetical protein
MRTYRHKRILDRQNTNSEKFDVPLLSPYMGQFRMLQYRREQKSNVHWVISLESSQGVMTYASDLRLRQNHQTAADRRASPISPPSYTSEYVT